MQQPDRATDGESRQRSRRVEKEVRPGRANGGIAPKIEIVDLSTPFVSLASPVYPGAPLPLRSTFMTIEETQFRSNVWVFEEHTGTHVDAPSHTVPKGNSIEKVELARCVGRAVVLDFADLPARAEIGRSDIKTRLRKATPRSAKNDHSIRDGILLFYTGYTKKFGTPAWLDNPVLGDEACRYLLELGVKAVGFDAASPDREPFPAHNVLLREGVALFENLANLDALLHREFIFVGVPLPLVEGTASPIRAIGLVF